MLAGKLDDRREADGEASEEAPQHSSRATPRHLVDRYQLVEHVEFFGLHSSCYPVSHVSFRLSEKERGDERGREGGQKEMKKEAHWICKGRKMTFRLLRSLCSTWQR